MTSDTLQKQYLFDPDFMYGIKNTKKPAEIDSKNYKAVHYIGGGSAMYDVPENKGIISSVCHGTAKLVVTLIHSKSKMETILSTFHS
ncbi:type 1 glutamine amidotransferase family protein [Pedobacter gandavensis]|uniref:hypothetical protein n=1 Tax=Pedobacter gandavensis TaxID=2679963 RepID=UPI0015FEC686|nr:hypothetical protein [Pedobacter gandavensis]